MYNFTFSRWQTLPAEPLSIIARSGMKYTNNKNNISEILKVYIINSITKSYILNIKIRPLVTEYALTIKLVGGTSSTHSFNPDSTHHFFRNACTKSGSLRFSQFSGC